MTLVYAGSARGNGRRKVLAASVAIAAVLGLGAAIAPTTPAAAVCTMYLYKTSSTTHAGDGPGCVYDKWQARLDRYYSGSPVALYGPQSYTVSKVTESSGSDAGHYYRFNGPNGNPWSQWIRF